MRRIMILVPLIIAIAIWAAMPEQLWLLILGAWLTYLAFCGSSGKPISQKGSLVAIVAMLVVSIMNVWGLNQIVAAILAVILLIGWLVSQISVGQIGLIISVVLAFWLLRRKKP